MNYLNKKTLDFIRKIFGRGGITLLPEFPEALEMKQGDYYKDEKGRKYFIDKKIKYSWPK